MTTKVQVAETLAILQTLYPNPETELVHSNPFELLVATILSAQCTDKRVNMVTPALFAAFPDPESMAAATSDEVASYIRSINFFPTKAKNLVNMAKQLLLLHGGIVPADQKALEQLAGVGRKTANVVLANAFGIPAFAVDTHVHRVANRLGWVKTAMPAQSEAPLMKKVPRSEWITAHHLLILHGRAICNARAPKCEVCPVQHLCNYGRTRVPVEPKPPRLPSRKAASSSTKIG